MVPDQEIRRARSAVGVAAWRGDAEGERTARERLAEAKLSRAIREAIAAAPPLTADARDRLALILLNGDGGDAV